MLVHPSAFAITSGQIKLDTFSSGTEILRWEGQVPFGEVHLRFHVWPGEGVARFDVCLDEQLLHQVFVRPDVVTSWDAVIACQKAIVILAETDNGPVLVSASIAVPHTSIPRCKRVSVWERLAMLRDECRKR